MKIILKSAVMATLTAAALTAPAMAQIGFTKSDADLQLAPDSPFRDPDVIYLEADDLVNDQEAGVLTAKGQVEGRYQDKTLRADEVRYSIDTGRVVAIGNVALINADGSTQYADKLELSDKLEAGNAANFTARFPEGGQLASAFAVRNAEDGIELYNAYYTACEACIDENGKAKKPSWRIKARKVSQNQDSNSIFYRDAVFEFKGIPLLYTPFLAHPDPSGGRQSGFMIPFAGLSGNKGLNAAVPYYFALTDYSELTVTPHVYEKVNPLLEVEFRKKFHSGEVNLAASGTYSSFFDNDGNKLTPDIQFTNPSESLRSKKWRSHIFTDGLFHINENWQWGFEGGYATDDNYLDRYDLDGRREPFGLIDSGSRRLDQEAFLTGQGDNFRVSVSAFGFASLRTSVNREFIRDPITGEIQRGPDGNALTDPNSITVIRENDSALPVVAPRIQLTQYLEAPGIGGRIKLFGDATVLTREDGSTGFGERATGYTRGSAGAQWSKNWISPFGMEVKPFAEARFDYFNLEAEDQDYNSFNRSTGQIGADIRWPFLKTASTDGGPNWIIEPRVQITQSFGDGEVARFTATNGDGQTVMLAQDASASDLDEDLLWQSNKAAGYDIWQQGFRADIGGSITADWNAAGRAQLFLGRSFYNGDNGNAYGPNSGLMGTSSDYVGQLEIEFGDHLRSETRIRYDDEDDVFRRIDTGMKFTSNRINADWRYYKLRDAVPAVQPSPDDIVGQLTTIPNEEISGSMSVRLLDNWSTKFELHRDLSQDRTRRQVLSLIYDDDCTLVELFYAKKDNGLGIIGQSDEFGLRVSLLTLGDFAGN